MMQAMKRKTFTPVQAGHVKIDASGAGTALVAFAQLNVVDKDGEITIPGAFKEAQAVRIMQYGHQWGELPVGRGAIFEDGEWAYADLKFFLGTDQGRNTYETIKEMGELQEWSYGFNVLDWEYSAEDYPNWNGKVRILKALDVFEVSPVMIGAGVGTHTVAIKSSGGKTDEELAAEREADTASALAAVIEYEVGKSRRLGVNV